MRANWFVLHGTSAAFAVIVSSFALFAVAPVFAEPSTDTAQPHTAEWPCPQHKVVTLTATQMWDGPAVETLTDWDTDTKLQSLAALLASRRVPMDTATEAIRTFAEALPASARDARLAVLFAAVLSRMNADRTIVVNGIEKFQALQKERAKQIAEEALEVARLKAARHGNAGWDTEAARRLAELEDRATWSVRVFQERQQNLPLACEIPVLIEQRLFGVGREIRKYMTGG